MTNANALGPQRGASVQPGQGHALPKLWAGTPNMLQVGSQPPDKAVSPFTVLPSAKRVGQQQCPEFIVGEPLLFGTPSASTTNQPGKRLALDCHQRVAGSTSNSELV